MTEDEKIAALLRLDRTRDRGTRWAWSHEGREFHDDEGDLAGTLARAVDVATPVWLGVARTPTVPLDGWGEKLLEHLEDISLSPGLERAHVQRRLNLCTTPSAHERLIRRRVAAVWGLPGVPAWRSFVFEQMECWSEDEGGEFAEAWPWIGDLDGDGAQRLQPHIDETLATWLADLGLGANGAGRVGERRDAEIERAFDALAGLDERLSRHIGEDVERAFGAPDWFVVDDPRGPFTPAALVRAQAAQFET